MHSQKKDKMSISICYNYSLLNMGRVIFIFELKMFYEHCICQVSIVSLKCKNVYYTSMNYIKKVDYDDSVHYTKPISTVACTKLIFNKFIKITEI